MATIATNLTLSKLIAKMREIAKETAESTYALSDALYDVQLIAENHEQTRKEANGISPLSTGVFAIMALTYSTQWLKLLNGAHNKRPKKKTLAFIVYRLRMANIQSHS